MSFKIHSCFFGFDRSKSMLVETRETNNIFFIGDIHGRFESLRSAINVAQKQNGVLICVGDFLDSYDRNSLDQMECLDLVSENDNVEAIPGNHCISYLGQNFPSCSGHSFSTKTILNSQMRSRKGDYLSFLRELPHAFLIENPVCNPILVTHAGLSADFLAARQKGIDLLRKSVAQEKLSPQNVFDAMDSFGHSLLAVGKARGGLSSNGGIFWSDLRKEFDHIPNLPQVFGHTRVPEITSISSEDTDEIGNTSFAIDCLDRKNRILNLKLEICNNKVEIVSRCVDI